MNLLTDNIKTVFMKYLIPSVSSAMAVALYSLVDTIAIGQGVGADGTAACAVVLPIFSIGQFIALLCGIGGCVLMGQARGEGRKEKGDAYYTTAVLYVSVITFVLWIFGVIFQESFYRLFGADDNLMGYAMAYGAWIFAFLPTFILVTFLGCFIRTDGNPKFVMQVTLIGGAVNVVGDWVFVFPMKMGMTGAALATVLGSVVQTLLLLFFILRRKTSLKLVKPYKWFIALKKISMIGFSTGIGSLAVVVLSFIANNQIMKYSGEAALAVYGMLGTVVALFICLFSGIGQAAQPIISENYGAGKEERCWTTARYGISVSILFGLVFMILFIVFPLEITGIFMKTSPEIIEIAPFILRVYALSFGPLAFNLFAGYYLQSSDSPRMAAAISLMRGIILNGILLYVLPLFMGGPGIWWAILAAEVFTAIVATGYLTAKYNRYKATAHTPKVS